MDAATINQAYQDLMSSQVATDYRSYVDLLSNLQTQAHNVPSWARPACQDFFRSTHGVDEDARLFYQLLKQALTYRQDATQATSLLTKFTRDYGMQAREAQQILPKLQSLADSPFPFLDGAAKIQGQVQGLLKSMNPVRAVLGGAAGIAAAWSATQAFCGLELGVIAFAGAESIAVAAGHVCAAGAAGYGVGWVDAKARHFVISNVAEKLLDRRDIGCEYDLAYVAFGSAYNYAAEAVGSDSRIETR